MTTQPKVAAVWPRVGAGFWSSTLKYSGATLAPTASQLGRSGGTNPDRRHHFAARLGRTANAGAVRGCTAAANLAIAGRTAELRAPNRYYGANATSHLTVSYSILPTFACAEMHSDAQFYVWSTEKEKPQPGTEESVGERGTGRGRRKPLVAFGSNGEIDLDQYAPRVQTKTRHPAVPRPAARRSGRQDFGGPERSMSRQSYGCLIPATLLAAYRKFTTRDSS